MRIVWRVNWVFLAAFVSLGVVLPSLSAAEEESKIEGLIEIDFPNAGEAKVEVNLAGTLFALAAKAMRDENPEASEFLANLKALRVRTYDGAAFGGKTYREVFNFYKQQLEKSKWEVLARVKEEKSTVGVYSLAKGDAVSGLVVLVGNPKEFIIVNLAGKIDLAKLSELSEVPQIGEISKLIPGKGVTKPDFVISGVVKDAATGKSIAGAKVSDHEYGPEPRKGATTDSDGKYSYTTWCEEHTIVAQAPGYKPQRQTLETGLLGKEKAKVVMDFALESE